MPRKKKPKIFDAITESLRMKFDNASLRDLIYFVSYMSGVFIAYELLTGKPIVEFLGIPRVPPVGQHTWISAEPKWIPPEEIDISKLAMAFVAGYMILQIEVEDVLSATNQLTALMKGSMGLVP